MPCVLEDSIPSICGWRGKYMEDKEIPFMQKHHALSYGQQRKTASVPWGPGFRPLLVLHGLLPPSPASISPGCFGASWEVETILIRLRAADTLWHNETRTPVSRAGCVQRITRPSSTGLLAEAWLPQGHSSQLHLLLSLSIAFIYTSIFLAVLVCHWLPIK